MVNVDEPVAFAVRTKVNVAESQQLSATTVPKAAARFTVTLAVNGVFHTLMLGVVSGARVVILLCA